jgi:threonine synthase
VATAIRIGDPVSWERARRAIALTNGVVTDVTDAEILEAKEHVDRAGIGCEPASAASLAGVRRMVREGTIAAGERVVCVLTGHLLKDPDTVMAGRASAIVEVDPTPDAVRRALA